MPDWLSQMPTGSAILVIVRRAMLGMHRLAVRMLVTAGGRFFGGTAVRIIMPMPEPDGDRDRVQQDCGQGDRT